MTRRLIWRIRPVLFFCAHGAGFVVPWDQVEDYMHLQSGVDMDALDSENWYENVENEDTGLSQGDNPAQSRRNSGKSGKKIREFFLQRQLCGGGRAAGNL